MMASTEETTITAASTNENKNVQGEELWTHELFGCFSDWKICLATFCCPCYTMGRNAEYFGEECGLVAGLYMLGCGLGFGPVIRWRTRSKKNIRGSMMGDVLAHYLCPCCALIQENKELYGLEGSHIGEKLPLNVEINRK